MHRYTRSAFVAGAVLLAGVGALACTRAVPDARLTKEPAASSGPAAPLPPGARPPTVDVAEPAPPGDALDERFASELKTVFATYKAWGRVDDELRWAPFLCRLPEPGRPAMSLAKEGGHARKLFSLFAKDRGAYVGAHPPDAGRPSSVGQVVVKESYVPEVLQRDVPAGTTTRTGTVVDGGLGEGDHFNPIITENGITYRASTLAGVYVMLRKQPSTPGTDDGWIYGTLRPNGELTSAGRVASCMGCHTTKPGRFLGQRAH